MGPKTYLEADGLKLRDLTVSRFSEREYSKILEDKLDQATVHLFGFSEINGDYPRDNHFTGVFINVPDEGFNNDEYDYFLTQFNGLHYLGDLETYSILYREYNPTNAGDQNYTGLNSNFITPSQAAVIYAKELDLAILKLPKPSDRDRVKLDIADFDTIKKGDDVVFSYFHRDDKEDNSARPYDQNISIGLGYNRNTSVYDNKCSCKIDNLHYTVPGKNVNGLTVNHANISLFKQISDDPWDIHCQGSPMINKLGELIGIQTYQSNDIDFKSKTRIFMSSHSINGLINQYVLYSKVLSFNDSIPYEFCGNYVKANDVNITNPVGVFELNRLALTGNFFDDTNDIGTFIFNELTGTYDGYFILDKVNINNKGYTIGYEDNRYSLKRILMDIYFWDPNIEYNFGKIERFTPLIERFATAQNVNYNTQNRDMSNVDQQKNNLIIRNNVVNNHLKRAA